MSLGPAPTTQCDQQCSHAAGEQRYCCRFRHHGPDYAIGEVVGLSQIGIASGREVIPKVGAIEERILVVATGAAHAVGSAGCRIKRTARAVADRRDIEPVVLAGGQHWQKNVQTRNLDLECTTIYATLIRLSNYRRVRGAAGDQGAAVPFGDASADFP